jgi:hypothetical protein
VSCRFNYDQEVVKDSSVSPNEKEAVMRGSATRATLLALLDELLAKERLFTPELIARARKSVHNVLREHERHRMSMMPDLMVMN